MQSSDHKPNSEWTGSNLSKVPSPCSMDTMARTVHLLQVCVHTAPFSVRSLVCVNMRFTAQIGFYMVQTMLPFFFLLLDKHICLMSKM